MKTHGKISTYRVSGCRCEPCTESNRTYQRNYKRKVRNSPLKNLVNIVTKTAIEEIKKNPCTDCGVSYPSYVMDFDHLPQYEKSFNLAFWFSYNQEDVFNELAKCELVCANCHRLRTHARKFNTNLT